jgi:hypothetical protein
MLFGDFKCKVKQHHIKILAVIMIQTEQETTYWWSYERY